LLLLQQALLLLLRHATSAWRQRGTATATATATRGWRAALLATTLFALVGIKALLYRSQE